MQRQAHQCEVLVFLQAQFSNRLWQLSLPKGSGHETYLAQADGLDCFVKLGARSEYYQVLAASGLTPPVLAAGRLEDGTSILIQAAVHGRKPTGRDFSTYAQRFAEIIGAVHRCGELKKLLPPIPSDSYNTLAVEALRQVQQKWARYKALVPQAVQYIEKSLSLLMEEARGLSGAGSAASHNDICNANWLISDDGKIYLIDLEAMSLDDPALDLGAFLWWYYPLLQRTDFLAAAGYEDSQPLRERMRVRMALHCLNILLPRAGSFDRFDSDTFADSLIDFQAVLAGEENPQGYADG